MNNFHRLTYTGGPVALVALLAAIVLQGCSKPAPPPAAAAGPAVTVAKPITREITDYDEFPGRIAAVESVALRARISGYLDKVNFREGDVVKAGQVLFILDRKPTSIDVERFTAELRRAQAVLELATNNVERGKRLVNTNAISQEEFDTLSKTRDQADANLAATRAALHAAQLNYDYTEVRAPITGRVGRALVTAGNLITGGVADGTLLTTIVSLDPVYVLFDADENTYLRYQKLARSGERVSGRIERKPLLLALANETEFKREGFMDFVDNKLDAATGTLRGRGVFRNTAALDLTPGMFARVRLPGSGKYQAVLVEDRAISTDLGRRIASVVDASGTVQIRPVEIGPLYQGLRVVRSGLSVDDLVIVDGLQRARPGSKVTPNQIAMREPGARLAAPVVINAK
ncbi:MAG TPA: efflux RND transporter periplasmic adaptor subunit [Usitatibacteraceae bacterium]